MIALGSAGITLGAAGGRRILQLTARLIVWCVYYLTDILNFLSQKMLYSEINRVHARREMNVFLELAVRARVFRFTVDGKFIAGLYKAAHLKIRSGGCERSGGGTFYSQLRHADDVAKTQASVDSKNERNCSYQNLPLA